MLLDWLDGPQLLMAQPYSREEPEWRLVEATLTAAAEQHKERIRPVLREAWDALLKLPIGESSAGTLTALPLDSSPPWRFRELVGLLRRAGEEELIRGLWTLPGSAPLPEKPAWLEHSAWMLEEDRAAPFTREELLKLWGIQCAHDLCPQSAEGLHPGLARVQLCAYEFLRSPARLLPRVLDLLNTSPTLDPSVFGLWAELRPAEAWAWLVKRWDGAEADERLPIWDCVEVWLPMFEHIDPLARERLLEWSTVLPAIPEPPLPPEELVQELPSVPYEPFQLPPLPKLSINSWGEE